MKRFISVLLFVKNQKNVLIVYEIVNGAAFNDVFCTINGVNVLSNTEDNI